MASEGPIFNIVGATVALGPLRRDLLPLYLRWVNDFSAMQRISSVVRPWTLEQEVEWFERQSVSETSVSFTIYERSSKQPIGTTELHDLDFRNGTAEFGILIGEAKARGKGYGSETAYLMLDYGFTALGLHNIMLQVFAFNLPARRAYEKAGFREIGRRREARPMTGKRWDLILMDALSTEFTGSVLADIFAPDQDRSRQQPRDGTR
ncbi:MAG TPA: GNAT family protein [Nitrolancea sp.]|nr:GNAT family protein [Nitrolancea sp.]